MIWRNGVLIVNVVAPVASLFVGIDLLQQLHFVYERFQAVGAVEALQDDVSVELR